MAMTWIFIGMLLGSTVTSNHDLREACEGRAAVLREKGVVGKCIQGDQTARTGITIFTGPSYTSPLYTSPLEAR